MIEQLAHSLGRKDEQPNVQLAEKLVESQNRSGIAEIVQGLQHSQKPIVNDCIKTLYEIGYRAPELIAPYAENFITQLHSQNNRLVWGACIALAQIADLQSELIFKHFDIIHNTYKNGSVITIDNCISIFAKLANAHSDYAQKIVPILIEHFQNCRPKEVPQHAERALVCIHGDNASAFETVFQNRYPELTAPQQKRLNKIFAKIEKIKNSGNGRKSPMRLAALTQPKR